MPVFGSFSVLLKRIAANDISLSVVNLYPKKRNSGIKNDGAIKLAKALQDNVVVAELYLGNNKVGNKGAAALAKALSMNSTLTKLYLGWNKICDVGARALAEMLQSNTKLTILDLIGNEITDLGVKVLADALQLNSTLAELDLSGNEIGDTGANALLEMLYRNFTLCQLGLDHNKISADLQEKIQRLVTINNDSDSPEDARRLKDAELGQPANNDAPAVSASESGRRSRTSSESVTETEMRLHPDAAIVVSKQRGQPQTVPRTATSHFDEILEGIAANNDFFDEVDLRSELIGDSGVIKLARALLDNTTVTWLQLGGNKIADAGAAAMANMLRHNSTLKVLHLGGNEITDVGARDLEEVLWSNSTLTNLGLGINKIIDAKLESRIERLGTINFESSSPEEARQRKEDELGPPPGKVSVVSASGSRQRAHAGASAQSAALLGGIKPVLDVGTADSSPSSIAKRSKVTVMAPPGKLGIILDDRSDAVGSFVTGVRSSSVLAHQVRPGDIIVSVNGEDVSRMTAGEISANLAHKSEFERVLTILTESKQQQQQQLLASPTMGMSVAATQGEVSEKSGSFGPPRHKEVVATVSAASGKGQQKRSGTAAQPEARSHPRGQAHQYSEQERKDKQRGDKVVNVSQSDIDLAIEAGDWAAVGALAAVSETQRRGRVGSKGASNSQSKEEVEALEQAEIWMKIAEQSKPKGSESKGAFDAADWAIQKSLSALKDAELGAGAGLGSGQAEMKNAKDRSRTENWQTESKSVISDLDAKRSKELDNLVDAGDWEGVVKAAAKYEAQSSRESDDSSSSEDDDSGNSEIPAKAQQLADIRSEVESLVPSVVPEEIGNVDEMMLQFRGREEELVETLRIMKERSIALKARTRARTVGGIEAVVEERERAASGAIADPGGQRSSLTLADDVTGVLAPMGDRQTRLLAATGEALPINTTYSKLKNTENLTPDEQAAVALLARNVRNFELSLESVRGLPESLTGASPEAQSYFLTFAAAFERTYIAAQALASGAVKVQLPDMKDQMLDGVLKAVGDVAGNSGIPFAGLISIVASIASYQRETRQVNLLGVFQEFFRGDSRDQYLITYRQLGEQICLRVDFAEYASNVEGRIKNDGQRLKQLFQPIKKRLQLAHLLQLDNLQPVGKKATADLAAVTEAVLALHQQDPSAYVALKDGTDEAKITFFLRHLKLGNCVRVSSSGAPPDEPCSISNQAAVTEDQREKATRPSRDSFWFEDVEQEIAHLQQANEQCQATQERIQREYKQHESTQERLRRLEEKVGSERDIIAGGGGSQMQAQLLRSKNAHRRDGRVAHAAAESDSFRREVLRELQDIRATMAAQSEQVIANSVQVFISNRILQRSEAFQLIETVLTLAGVDVSTSGTFTLNGKSYQVGFVPSRRFSMRKNLWKRRTKFKIDQVYDGTHPVVVWFERNGLEYLYEKSIKVAVRQMFEGGLGLDSTSTDERGADTSLPTEHDRRQLFGDN